jgi:hypothetical protein
MVGLGNSVWSNQSAEPLTSSRGLEGLRPREKAFLDLIHKSEEPRQERKMMIPETIRLKIGIFLCRNWCSKAKATGTRENRERIIGM